MDATTLPQTDEVETIHKQYVKDLREKQSIHTVFKVTRKARQTSRSGKVFLTVTLGDRTGEVDARVFDNVEAIEPMFLEGDFVLVKGNVITWQKRPQVVIEQLERLDPEPIDPAEFDVPPPPAPPAGTSASPQAAKAGGKAERPEAVRAVAQIREIVDRVTDPHIQTLLMMFLEDPELEPGLATAPAAKGIHHAWRGGLAEHILSVMKLAHRIADHYPMADRDLLVAGALLHDICKVREIAPERGGFEYTDEGRLVGHIVMTAQKIREKVAQIPGFPTALEHHITHIVLAHHGQLEWGSPKVPMTLEALLVHLIDTVDSRVASWLEIMERDPSDGPWTETSRLYDRHLWKGPVPTVRNRSPLEGRPIRRGAKPKQAQRQKQAKPQADRELPTFKPLEQIAQEMPGEAQSPAPHEPAQPPEAPEARGAPEPSPSGQ